MSIEKISNAVWTVVGLAIGIIMLLALLFSVVIGGMSFYKHKIHKVDGVTVNATAQQPSKDGLKLTVQYGLPFNVEKSDYFIVPVALEKKQGEEEGRSSFEASSRKSGYDSDSSGYMSDLHNRFWGPFYNLVFVSKATGESRALLDEKGFIKEVYFPGVSYGGEKEEKTKPTFILYKIAMADTSGDGLINEKDALGGFISAPDGTKLTRITPEDFQMNGWSFDKESQTLFIGSVQDANHDLKFNSEDPKRLLRVNVLDPKMGVEVISKEFESKISSLLNAQ